MQAIAKTSAYFITESVAIYREGDKSYCAEIDLLPHQALVYQTPAKVFNLMPVEVTNEGMVESLTSNTLRIAGHALNIAPILS